MWTDDKPTTDGHYWYKSAVLPPLVMDVRTNDVELFAFSYGVFLRVATMHGQWSSKPVTPPSEEIDRDIPFPPVGEFRP